MAIKEKELRLLGLANWNGYKHNMKTEWSMGYTGLKIVAILAWKLWLYWSSENYDYTGIVTILVSWKLQLYWSERYTGPEPNCQNIGNVLK